MRLAIGRFDDADRQVAGAAGDIEHGPTGAPRRIEPADHRIFPQPVQPARHQIVHQVVATGDLMENLVDERLLVVCGRPRLKPNDVAIPVASVARSF